MRERTFEVKHVVALVFDERMFLILAGAAGRVGNVRSTGSPGSFTTEAS
jgi:hypothetical protein